MLTDIIMDIFHSPRALGKRRYGGYVKIDSYDIEKIQAGIRLCSLQAESVIESVIQQKKAEMLPMVTYIASQQGNEAIVAWFWILEDESGNGSIRPLRV